MSNFSPFAIRQITTAADDRAPGSPGITDLVLLPKPIVGFAVYLRMPALDEDGSPLTGLFEALVACVKEVTPGESPLGSIEPAELASAVAAFAPGDPTVAQIELISLTDADAGKDKGASFEGLELNTTYWVYATVRDDAAVQDA